MTHYQAYDKSSYSFYKLQIQAYLDNIDAIFLNPKIDLNIADTRP